MFSGVFTAEEDDGIADKELGDSITVDVQSLLGAFWNMSLRSASFIHDLFFWKKVKLLVFGLTPSRAGLPGFPNYKMSD